MVPPSAKLIHGIFPQQLRPGTGNSLINMDLGLPSTARQCSVVCYYRISQVGPRNETKYSLELICLCLAVLLCLTMGSETMVLVGLLHIGAKDLTVTSPFVILIVFQCFRCPAGRQ